MDQFGRLLVLGTYRIVWIKRVWSPKISKIMSLGGMKRHKFLVSFIEKMLENVDYCFTTSQPSYDSQCLCGLSGIEFVPVFSYHLNRPKGCLSFIKAR